MPRYDYRCSRCGVTVTQTVRYEVRMSTAYCDCGGALEYQFPVQAALGYRPFTPFYCEPFGCDVRGRKEWQEILRSKGLVEKGDRAGIRLEEKSPHACKIMPTAPRGITYADVQRKAEQDKERGKRIEQLADIRTTGGSDA